MGWVMEMEGGREGKGTPASLLLPLRYYTARKIPLPLGLPFLKEAVIKAFGCPLWKFLLLTALASYQKGILQLGILYWTGG